MAAEPEAKATAADEPEALGSGRAAWSLWIGGLVSVGMLVAIGLQLRRTSPATFTTLTHLSPAVFAAFAALYMVQPLGDLAIYRRIWRLPVSAIGELLRKTAINEAILGYSGELYLYLWARRRAGLAYPAFGAIRDVNILSSLMGFAATLVMLLLSLAWAKELGLVQVLRPVLLPASAVMALAVVVLIVVRRVFALRPDDVAFIAAVHAARVAAMCGLTLLMWSLALPTVPLQVWVVLLAVTLLGSRLPFLTNKSLIVGNIVLLLMGPSSPFAVLVAATAVATLLAHLAVVAVMGGLDVLRALRRR